MSSIWVIGYVFTALGFGIGGIIAWILQGIQKRIDLVYSICAGLILGLLSFEVAPEAIQLGGWLSFILGFLIGVTMFTLIHKSFKVPVTYAKNDEKHFSLFTGLVLIISISFHNLPIGIILGSNLESSLSTSILKMIILHNIPEGIIVCTFMFVAGLGIWTLLLLTLIVAIPVGIGAYFGGIVGIDNPFIWSIIISFSIGLMYMVTVKEILMDSIQNSTSIQILTFTLLGFGSIGLYFAFI